MYLHEVSSGGKVNAQRVMNLPITPRVLTFIQEISCKLYIFVNTQLRGLCGVNSPEGLTISPELRGLYTQTDTKSKSRQYIIREKDWIEWTVGKA